MYFSVGISGKFVRRLQHLFRVTTEVPEVFKVIPDEGIGLGVGHVYYKCNLGKSQDYHETLKRPYDTIYLNFPAFFQSAWPLFALG